MIGFAGEVLEAGECLIKPGANGGICESQFPLHLLHVAPRPEKQLEEGGVGLGEVDQAPAGECPVYLGAAVGAPQASDHKLVAAGGTALGHGFHLSTLLFAARGGLKTYLAL